MTVQWRVVVLTATSLVFLALMTGIVALALWSAEHSASRVAGIHGRLDVLTQLSARLGNYGEGAAEILLLGRDQVDTTDQTDNAGQADNLSAARIDIERLLARLTQVTRAEISALSGMQEIRDELPELETSRRIIEVYHSIDAAMNNALAMQRGNQLPGALGVFARDVSFRLNNELQPLVTSSADGERDELDAQVSAIAATWTQLLIAAAVVAVLALAALLALGFGLRRSIAVPLAALTAQAKAVSKGEALPAAPALGSDFAPLAESLASLSDSVAEQRRGFAEAGERLSSEVEARTAQLSSANEQLREVDRRRGQFLADVSHELRTPLTILRGEADVALRGKDDPKLQRQSLERIQGQAAELGQLLEDLIEFARSTAEDQPFVFADTQLDQIIAAAAQEAETLAAPREVTVAVNLADHGRHLDADFRRLKQALIIGLDNAIKHSPPGTTVTIATGIDGDKASISILDEGSGVEAGDLPRVFERFFRGRHEGDSLIEGIGIGLAIAKDIVERHGGSIGLGNRPEGGAVLRILLPIGVRAA